jgi:hypothetical protein
MSSSSLGLFGSLALSAFLAGITHAQIEVKTISGSAPGDRFGWAVSPVGDVDNDSIGDFAVGAPLSDANGTDSGEVRVYSGRTQQLVRTWVGSGSKDFFGWSIAKAGDLDADGFDDVLIGAPETYDWYSVWASGSARASTRCSSLERRCSPSTGRATRATLSRPA